MKMLRRFVDGDVRRVVVVGYSMGGVVVMCVVKILEIEFGVSDLVLMFVGLVLIDIVEGSVMKAFSAMGAFVDARLMMFVLFVDVFYWFVM